MKRRSRKGAGSVFRRERDGMWVARTPPVRGQRREFVRKTQAEANAALRDAMAEGLGTTPTATVPLGTYAKQWLEIIEGSNLAASTIETYRSDIVNHVIPRLGAIRLGDLSASQIAEWTAALKRDGVGVRAVSKSFAALRRLLSAAVGDELIVANPAKSLDPARKPKYQAPEAKVLTLPQTRKLLDTISSHRLWALATLTAYTGARQSEYIGLRWRDLDLKARRLRIERNLVLVGNAHEAGTPKTRSSNREIALGKTLVPLLSAHRERMKAEGQDMGPDGLVFPATNGEPIRRQNLLRDVLYPALERARLPRVTWHQLRHSLATNLIEAGEPVEVVSRLFGHADTTITQRTYSKAFARRERQTANAVDKMIALGKHKVSNKVSEQKATKKKIPRKP